MEPPPKILHGASGHSRTREQIHVVAQAPSNLRERRKDAREHSCRHARHVIIVARELGAVHVEQLRGVVVGKVLKVQERSISVALRA